MNHPRPLFQLIPAQQIPRTWVGLYNRKVYKKKDRIIVLYVQIVRAGTKGEDVRVEQEGYFGSRGYRIREDQALFELMDVANASHVAEPIPTEVINIVTEEVAYRNSKEKFSNGLTVRIFRHEYFDTEITEENAMEVEQIYPYLGGAPLDRRMVRVQRCIPAPDVGVKVEHEKAA